jgi:hypothetical protein
MVGGGALAALHISCDLDAQHPLLDGPGALVLGNALRTSTTLTSLTLGTVGPWTAPDVAAALLGALVAHGSLQTLHLAVEGGGIWQQAGPFDAATAAALGALVAADAPALTDLDVSGCALGDATLGPLFAALPRNTHLRTLFYGYNALTEAFYDAQLLPAVLANASLRRIDTWASPWLPATIEALLHQRLVADAQ